MTKEEVLKHVNDFLSSIGKDQIGMNDTLWTSGILDSLGIFQLVLYFDKIGYPLDKSALTQKSVLIDLIELDTIEKINNHLL
jgi:hypothetical protein